MSIFGNSANKTINALNRALTEIDLTCISLQARKFANLSIKNLLYRILENIDDSLINVDARIRESFYGNTASTDQYQGLFDLIVNNYICTSINGYGDYAKTLNYGKENSYSRQLIQVTFADGNNKNIIYAPINDKVYSSTQVIPPNCFYIDYSNNSDYWVLLRIYVLMYNAIEHSIVSSNIANKPILGLNGLRTEPTGQEKYIEASVQRLSEAMNGKGGIGYMDSKDTFQVTDIDAAQATSLLQLSLTLLCNTTNFSMAFHSGEIGGGLSTTGEGNEKQDYRALRSWFRRLLRPILVRVGLIINAEEPEKVDIEETDTDVLDANAGLIPIAKQIVEDPKYYPDTLEGINIIRNLMGSPPLEELPEAATEQPEENLPQNQVQINDVETPNNGSATTL